MLQEHFRAACERGFLASGNRLRRPLVERNQFLPESYMSSPNFSHQRLSWIPSLQKQKPLQAPADRG